MVDRLTELGAIFERLDFGSNRVDCDDLPGDACEYLMRHFATMSGKSRGQFYVPFEVSRTMAHVIDLGKAAHAGQSIYDPTCGSGLLLLKAQGSRRTTKPKAAPGSTWPCTGKRWTTPPAPWTA